MNSPSSSRRIFAEGAAAFSPEASTSTSKTHSQRRQTRRVGLGRRPEDPHADALLRVASRLNSRLTVHDVCEAICEEAARTIGAPAGVFLFDTNLQAFVPEATFDMPAGYAERYIPTSREIYNGHVRAMGDLFLFTDAQATPDLPNHALYRDVNMRTIGVASLIREGEVLGLLKVYSFGKTRRFNASELALLQGVAHQASQALANARLFDQTQQLAEELRGAYDATIEGWALALDLRDKETEGHSRRVTEMALQLSKAMGVLPEQLEDIRRGALLHDIGKMGVPDSILLKPGPLTPEERTIMQQHTLLAQKMLSRIVHLHRAIEIPLSHHEKWEGGGYPHNLRGEEIPLPARIFAVVDVFDALTNERPYKKAWTIQDALAEIRSQSGRHFDPAVVEAFLTLLLANPG
jgi:putative nucleotidyltransferase with HDIG domain